MLDAVNLRINHPSRSSRLKWPAITASDPVTFSRYYHVTCFPKLFFINFLRMILIKSIYRVYKDQNQPVPLSSELLCSAAWTNRLLASAYALHIR